MTDEREYGNIKIPQSEFDKHNARRKDMGLSWSEYVNTHAPEYVEREALWREIVREETRRAMTDYAVAESTVREAVREALEEVARV